MIPGGLHLREVRFVPELGRLATFGADGVLQIDQGRPTVAVAAVLEDVARVLRGEPPRTGQVRRPLRLAAVNGETLTAGGAR